MSKNANPTSNPAFTPAGFFVLRAPLLPLAEFLNWGDEGEAAAANDEEALAQALTADRARLRARLRALLEQPEIRDAIFIASPDLDEYIEHWLREPDSKRGERVEGALVRYFTRMCSRSTPFGLFAATTLGRVGDATVLSVAGRNDCERHTRLDMDYLFALVNALVKDTQLRRELRYQPNSSLYYAGGRVRYVESRLRGKQRSYHLVAVEQTDYLAATLQRAAMGASIAELVVPLIDDEITQEDAEDFIEQLIECQLLVPDLALPVTGQEPIHPVIAKLRALTCTSEVAAVLEKTRDDLAALDAAGLGAAPEQYRAVAEKLKSLPAEVELPRLFQVDLVRPANAATLGESVINEISAGAELLRSLFAKEYENELGQFRQAFVNRYEEREVPLAEALDDDLGIGFPISANGGGNAPLLNGLALGKAGEVSGSWRQRENYLLEKLIKIWAAGDEELTLTDKDVETLKLKEPLAWPNTFSVMCKLAAASPGAIAVGDFQIAMDGVGGPSGANLFGRFCHADAALQQEVEQHLRAEEAQQPDAVFAEIAHLPEGRIGNILARPVLRDYEIPYLGVSGAPPERQLPLTDLMVSVRDGRVVLRSAQLNCEIVPRLTSAHNWSYERASAYKFLCALQAQSRLSGVSWDWEGLNSAPFLPRVKFGRLVLAQARWLAGHEELKNLAASATTAARFQAVQRWRNERKLPRYVVLADGDNTLPIDLENVLSVDSFVQIVKNRNGAELREMWPTPDHLCATGSEGAFVHELIVPFVRQSENATMLRLVKNAPAPAICAERSFAPGSEWLYAKIYCGAVTADQVLREAVNPVMHNALSSGAADGWFFIRYSDPDNHLRVRFHGQPQRLREDVFPALYAALSPWMADGRVRRMQLDTYEREVERYGGDVGMMLSEKLFHADSLATSEIIGALDATDASTDERWRLTLCGMDRMLNDFGFDLAGKAEILKSLRAAFLKEFGGGETLIDQLGDRYRQERKALEPLLDLSRDGESSLAMGLEIFARRSIRLQAIAEELRDAESRGQLTRLLADIAASHLHLHANRMLRSAHRAQELVIYDLLTRLYSSLLARQRQPNQNQLARQAA